jgi:hypothetical protein
LQETCAYLRHRRTFAAKVVAAPRLHEVFTVDFDYPGMFGAVSMFIIIVLSLLALWLMRRNNRIEDRHLEKRIAKKGRRPSIPIDNTKRLSLLRSLHR